MNIVPKYASEITYNVCVMVLSEVIEMLRANVAGNEELTRPTVY